MKDGIWLARHHDLNAFLDELYVASGTSRDLQVHALQPAVLAALAQLP